MKAIHAIQGICLWCTLLSAAFTLSACSSKGCQGPLSSSSSEVPLPPPQTPPKYILTEAATGLHLGNARALSPKPTQPSTLLAASFQGSKVVSVDHTGQHHTLDLQARGLGGVHELPFQPDTAAVLEFQGDRVFLVQTSPKPTLVHTASVCKGPRSLLPMRSAPHGWLLCRDAPQKLHLLDLKTLKTLRSFHVGDAPSDMVLSPDESTIFVSDFQSKTIFAFPTDPNTDTPGELLAVPLEPLRLVAPKPPKNNPPKTPLLYVTHPSSNHITVLDLTTNTVRRNIDLRCPPSSLIASPEEPFLYAVCPGTGTLLVLSTHSDQVLQRYTVPEGSYDLQWSSSSSNNQPRLLLSGGPSGKLQVWYPLSENVRPVHTFSLPWPSGPIHRDTTPGFFWVLSPQAGQLARIQTP